MIDKTVEEEEGTAILAQIDESVHKALEQSGIEQFYWTAQLKKIPAEIASRFPENIRGIFKKDGRLGSAGLGLSGSAGSGKTFAMAVIARQLWRVRLITKAKQFGQPIFYMPYLTWCDWPKWSDEIKFHSTRNMALAEELVRKLSVCPVVALDDLGVERIRGSYREDFSTLKLDRILDERYKRQLPTFFTTNLDYDELISNYGARMFSRLVGLNRFVELPDMPDLRIQVQKREK